MPERRAFLKTFPVRWRYVGLTTGIGMGPAPVLFLAALHRCIDPYCKRRCSKGGLPPHWDSWPAACHRVAGTVTLAEESIEPFQVTIFPNSVCVGKFNKLGAVC